MNPGGSGAEAGTSVRWDRGVRPLWGAPENSENHPTCLPALRVWAQNMRPGESAGVLWSLPSRWLQEPRPVLESREEFVWTQAEPALVRAAGPGQGPWLPLRLWNARIQHTQCPQKTTVLHEILLQTLPNSHLAYYPICDFARPVPATETKLFS